MYRPNFIAVEETIRLLADDNACLFDVRESGEAEKGHIALAIFLPRRQIELRLAALVPDPGSRIVLYDDGGNDNRAALAAQRIVEFGYRDVSVLQNGIEAWRSAGGKVSTGSNVPSKEFGETLASSVPSVPADRLATWLDEGNVTICDIRTPEEYARARVPGASSMPSFEIAGRLGTLSESKVPIVVNCAGRTRSIIACATLRLLGVSDVFALENGTMGWRLSNRELESGPASIKVDPPVGRDPLFEQTATKLAAGAGIEPLTSVDLESLLRQSAEGKLNGYAFDVRQLPDYIAGHIDGSQALPGGQAVQRADEFVAIRKAPTVFIDSDEGRAAITAYWFVRMGYPRATYLKAGLNGWLAEGRRLVTGRGRQTPLGLAAAAANTKFIDSAELDNALRAGKPMLVLYVDNSREYSDAHIARSKWLPRGSLEREIGALTTDKNIAIVLTCVSEIQSVFAADTLSRLGFINVWVLKGGIKAWSEAGYNVETGLPVGVEMGSDIVLPPYARGTKGMHAYLEWEKALPHG